jgi:hypothetical protein
MKLLLGLLAIALFIGGMVNLWLSINASTPIPVLISQPLAILAMGYLLFQSVFPLLLYGTISPQTSEAADRLRQSGAELATTLCGGKIGRLHFRGPLLRVRVFPGGLLIKPALMPAVPIFRHEITYMLPRVQLMVQDIELSHMSPLVRTPIRLGISIHSPVGQALTQITAPGLP